ncbi:hypothetical protein N7539_003865 [Penicillium diatomitis]|uniref:Uncharacterized protein n=1 Tax=Penicillium diatomitis TaxID=2819901 RepID=A0A9W9XCR3_9EURO|nr:uncharacterized protein N7539_003865 [Penicillium diatomitis]KAJ5488975.1 hypothetical protein N7539_003865 [Penicillium diatomitis]
MLHIELFYHLLSDTLPGLDVQLGETDLVGLVPHLLKAPYMVNELLAFSALHLSTRHPERCKYYRTLATQLQTHAIANFQEGGLVIDQETCVPAVMFSSIVGLHALCDSLVHREKDFAHFVDKFVHCFRLHLGVRTVFTEAWAMIRQSVLKPLLADVERQHHFDGRLGLGCAKLLRLVQAANLGDHLTRIYKQAIEQLQVSANVFIPSAIAGSQFFGAGWPLLVCSEYNDLLLQRRPEALVILAHYAIMLQCCRGSWIVGDGGHYIIQSTRDWLGSEWAEWLEWAVTDVEDPVKLLLQVYG